MHKEHNDVRDAHLNSENDTVLIIALVHSECNTMRTDVIQKGVDISVNYSYEILYFSSFFFEIL